MRSRLVLLLVYFGRSCKGSWFWLVPKEPVQLSGVPAKWDSKVWPWPDLVSGWWAVPVGIWGAS